ncbi:MAG: tRNA (adenosine(37)-N6)-threonylcarbamoyltransferase complex ATPase subunit type 1 TsaE [Eggerthellaceae bacterium]|jgi:tRNA threonylcarbamoyladenosine biosynthesis protein TsaE|nr:tRNA (adenosine(37)-N6)-threonylcarbamoyltransferase complex ATPase subunit type 1 TsaE [Eggerthellaceae bacterium]MCH4220843.1 tRNA (adenosine(37)-N6)-threonylcarbamoyltransferase complex ATPase subunit type 1 TsaE [Eggerthellaceae bacterium]
MDSERTYIAHSHSVEDTQRLAASLVRYVQAQDVVLLDGDLGAGKTHFVQGIAHAMGIHDEVTSPTFTILLSYPGIDHNGASLTLNHFDLYRLDDPADLDDIGYWETLEGPGVSFIEWGHKFASCLPFDYLDISIDVIGEDDRVFTICACGDRARRLLAAWAQDEEAWLTSSTSKNVR